MLFDRAELPTEADNTYSECERCGHCCELTILSVTTEEAQAIADYVELHGIEPKDHGPYRCPFQEDDKTCMIYPVRAQTCKLHNCHIPRWRLLEIHPNIIAPDDKPLIDMRRAFLQGDFSDPRFTGPHQD